MASAMMTILVGECAENNLFEIWDVRTLLARLSSNSLSRGVECGIHPAYHCFPFGGTFKLRTIFRAQILPLSLRKIYALVRDRG